VIGRVRRKDYQRHYCLFSALKIKNSPLIHFIVTNIPKNIKNDFGETLLHIAVLLQDLDLVDTLIACGYDVQASDYERETPLHNAIYCSVNQTEKTQNNKAYVTCYLIFKKLLDAHIKQRHSIEDPNVVGWTPLHLAILVRDQNMISALIQADASPDEIMDQKDFTPKKLVKKINKYNPKDKKLHLKSSTWNPLLKPQSILPFLRPRLPRSQNINTSVKFDSKKMAKTPPYPVPSAGLDFTSSSFLGTIKGQPRLEFWQQPIISKDTQAIKQGRKIIDVSGYDNNCGLFALALGVKLAFLRQKNVDLQPQYPPYLNDLSEELFRKETRETVQIGKLLRETFHAKLMADDLYKKNNYFNFVSCCEAYLARALALTENTVYSFLREIEQEDMEAFLRPNITWVNSNLLPAWLEIKDSVEEAINENLLLELNKIDIQAETVSALSQQFILLLSNGTEIHSDIGNLLTPDQKADLTIEQLIKLRKLCQLAWRRVKEIHGTSEQRKYLSGRLGKFLEQETLKQLSRNTPNKIDELVLILFLEDAFFDVKGQIKVQEINSQKHNETLRTARCSFIKKQLILFWDQIYLNYCKNILESTMMLSADELGYLANVWEVQLTIQFNNDRKYHSYNKKDNQKLQVCLCNPALNHWQVIDDAQGLLANNASINNDWIQPVPATLSQI
jgi:hypothetical protein